MRFFSDEEKCNVQKQARTLSFLIVEMSHHGVLSHYGFSLKKTEQECVAARFNLYL